MSPTRLLPSTFLAIVLLSLPAWSASPDNSSVPRGRFAELHSCELYAGPCVINSEANQAGNYQMRVWQFDQGTLSGVPLRGLSVALLEKSDENLADGGNASDAVAYLPSGLSSRQRDALVTWVRQRTAAPLDDAHVRIAPLQINLAEKQVHFSAGTEMTFTGGAPIPCALGSCGEMVWYQPRVASTSYVVDQLGDSRIVEPLLALRWMDYGRLTLFVGRFGDPQVTLPALCGAPQTAAL